MSNESENERIDLTQFEGLPKKMEIKWHEHPLYGARYLVQISEPETPWAVGAIAPDYEPHGVYAKDKIEQEKMAKMFAKTPDLIAELKKLYEFMDLHQICGCGAICPRMNKETWARVKRCGFCYASD